MIKNSEIKPAIRYSESFKIELVRELEAGGINFCQMMRKYDIRGYGTLQRWVAR
jgi:transposase-like protein